MDFDVEKLQHYRLIQRILCARNGLILSDWDLLLYLNPIKLFNKHDFIEGKFSMSWDNHRFYRLQKLGWLKKVHDGKGWNSGHTKYTVSQKTKIMFSTLQKVIDGKRDLPSIPSPKNRVEKRLNFQALKFNNLKYRDYDED